MSTCACSQKSIWVWKTSGRSCVYKHTADSFNGPSNTRLVKKQSVQSNSLSHSRCDLTTASCIQYIPNVTRLEKGGNRKVHLNMPITMSCPHYSIHCKYHMVHWFFDALFWSVGLDTRKLILSFISLSYIFSSWAPVTHLPIRNTTKQSQLVPSSRPPIWSSLCL